MFMTVLYTAAGAVALARVRRLYYGAADPKSGAVESGETLERAVVRELIQKLN